MSNTEDIIKNFRNFLNESSEHPVELGVLKSSSSSEDVYVLFDTQGLIKLCINLKNRYDSEKLDPNISREDLINGKLVISAIKTADNTEEMKAQFGTCMNAAHIKVSAVNKNLKGFGYGKFLYKIVTADHPEGVTPDRDFVSGTAFKAWTQLAKDFKIKTIKDPQTGNVLDKFDNIKNPKTPTPEDDCVVHTQDEFADSSVLDKVYLYNGIDPKAFFNKGRLALENCEQILDGMWPVEALEDILTNAGMMLYDLAIGYEGPLQEARLNKTWRRRALSRARRNGRDRSNQEDLKWAHHKQSTSHKKHPELEELYLKEIEAATNAVALSRNYLKKIKEVRKTSAASNFPFTPDKTGGVASVYQKRSKRLKGATAASGESFGTTLETLDPDKEPAPES